jgi:4-hydroxybenzoate polyprenyltransferase
LSAELGTRHDQAKPKPANRWWIYQKERFPVLGHGPLILAFSFSAVSFSFLLRGGHGFPRPASLLVAFVTSLVFFLQLRLADEFKDFEEDSRYRPYRAVPRGLVTLRELGAVFVMGGLLQLGLALWLSPLSLTGLLLVVWLYLALMSQEFFVRDWIKARPFTYMWTHMLIMPLIDFYATACDWLAAGLSKPPPGLFWFLVVSFFNGIVIEIGRKLRAPADEETGVQTYTALWGRRKAVAAWMTALACTALSAWQAARSIHFVVPVVELMVILLAVASLIAGRFLKMPVTRHAKLFEYFSGAWTLLMYLSLGAVPCLLRAWGKG